MEFQVNKLLLISSALIAVGGLVFIVLSICGMGSNNEYLIIGLGYCALANLFNLVRHLLNKKK